MSDQDFRKAWIWFRALLDTLREQGVTNSRQLLEWLRSYDVSTAIVTYLRAHPGLQSIVYWAAAIAVGFFAVGYAWVFNECVMLAQSTLLRVPWSLLIITPVAFLFSWWLVWRFAPGAAGGGIPEVMAALEVDPQAASTWVGARAGLIKFASSVVCVLGGGAIGREGPTIQIAASIFYTLGMPLKRIWPSLSHQSLLVAGGSAGIAAAFNTPLGGIVFAVEELSQQHFNRFKTFLISAVIVSGLVAQWLLGPYLYLGYPKLNVITFSALPWSLAVGVLAGLAGACFGKALAHISDFFLGARPGKRIKFAVSAGLVIAGAAWAFGPEVLGSGTDLMNRVLFEDNTDIHWSTVIARFVAPLVSSVAGGATGMFAPSLAAGAAIGAKFSDLFSSPYPHLLILIGMASFLTGMTRAPFTAFVLVLEMTDRHSAIFPLMMASLVASLVARIVDGKSCYERRVEGLLLGLKAPTQVNSVPDFGNSHPHHRNPSAGSTESPGGGPLSP